MTAVHEDRQAILRGRPRSISASIAFHRATREQDVVHEHDRPPRDVDGDPGLVHLRGLRGETDVVPVERDVEDADRDVRRFDPCDLRRQPEREVVTAVGDPDQHEAVGRLALDDLVGDPASARRTSSGPRILLIWERPPRQARRRAGCTASDTPFPASRDRT